MRKNGNHKMLEVYCNACGRKLRMENGMEKEGVFRGRAEWGYFSEKDGETHRFDLCEPCYDKWISTFRIPVEKSYTEEWL